jgi:hypothetical protein
MPAKRPRFFEKTYEGRRFAGIMTADGPYVFDLTAARGSALYRSTIVHSGRVQWWVAEGDIFNSRIPLNSLSDAARKELAYDFGLSFAEGEARSPIAEQKPIRKAAAVEGLIHWMEENRGFAKQRGGDNKLKPNWASMSAPSMGAILEVKVLPRADHSERNEVQLREGDRAWEGSME